MEKVEIKQIAPPIVIPAKAGIQIPYFTGEERFSPKSEKSRLTSASCLNILLINGRSNGDFLYRKKSLFSVLYRLYNHC